MSRKEFSTIPSSDVQAKNEKNRVDVALDSVSGGKYTPIQENGRPGILKDHNGLAAEKHVTIPDVEFEKKGKKKKKDEDGSKPVSFFQLFRYSDSCDKILLFFGTIAAMLSGCAIPVNLYVYGKVANAFIYYTIYKNLKNNFNATAAMAMNMSRPAQLDELSEYAELADETRSYAIYFCLIGIGSFLFSFLAGVCWNLTAEHQMNRMRKLFFQSVMRQDMSWFDTHQSGEIAVKFTENMHLVADGIGEKVATFIQWISTFLVAYILAFYSGWKLALATFGGCPLVIIIGAVLVRMVQTVSKEESDAYSKAGAVAEEALSSIRTVAAFSGQDKECERFREHLGQAKSISTRKGIFLGLGTSVMWVIIYGVFSLAFWYGVKLVQDGEPNFDAGNTLIVFISVMIGSMSLGQAFPTLEVIGNAKGAAQKVFHIIELQSSIDSLEAKGDKPSKAVGNVEFRNVVFNYPSRPSVQVLQGLNLEVKVGQTVALVGASGCGKSTVIQLLQRFYDPQEGQVFVDGKNVKDLNVMWLRQQIGVVSQEPVLFATSISENIRYGRLDVTQEEIVHAAREANAHSFIEELPEGYDTLVGERGAQLSGGQKQRIAIARALVRNPKILLLDEATSALDNESEAVVQKALEKAEQGRTTIVIAHRLSTIRNADLIYGILDGQVIEQGTHDQLMQKKEGLYSQLVTLQTQHIDSLSDEEELVRTYQMTGVTLFDLSHDSHVTGASFVADELEHQIFEEEDEESALIHKLQRDTPKAGSLRKRKFQSQTSAMSHHSEQGATEGTTALTEEELEKDTESMPEVSLLKVLRMNSPEWYLILVACLSSAIAGCVQPLFAIILSEFLKVFTLTSDEQNDQSVQLVAYVMAIAVGNAILRLLMAICFTKSGTKLTTRFRMLAFKSMIWQEMSYFDDHKNRVGVLTTKLASDAALVQGATGNKIGAVLEALSTVFCALTVAFIYSWKLTLVMMAFLPLMITAGIIHGRVLKGFSKGDKTAMEEAGKICNEAIENVRTVASLTREQSFLDKFDEHVDKILSVGRKRSVIHALVFSFSQCMMFFAYAAAFSYGGYLVQHENLGFENVFRVFGAIVFGGMSVGRNTSYAPDYKKGKMAATRLFSVIESKPKIDASSNEGVTMESFSGGVELDHIKFSYPSRPDVQVLKDLSITARPGETLALVGTSGCGKSTTVQLIERFYDPQNGAVMLDGSDIKKLNLRWLRSQIGIVSQEPVLFDTSVAENIAYGDNSRVVPMNDIIQAARNANIHNFIESLPNGYDTNVGDKGTQLSGGQKQRVAIARALLRNPKVLLLDEATSALDSESERVVQEALDKARKGRTCLVIAHRLSTIQNADKIAIFHKGEIVELGSHSELMALKGVYYKLQEHNRKSEPSPE